MYLEGQGIEVDLTQAQESFRTAAEQGYAEAQCDYGLMLLDGLGVAQDAAAAFKWFSLAAEQGSLAGQTYLGMMYVNGLGVRADTVVGQRWLGRAAGRGSPMAQANLGVMYARGVGVERDVSEALIWLFMARQGGMGGMGELIRELERPLSPEDVSGLRRRAEQRLEEGSSQSAMAAGKDGIVIPSPKLAVDSAVAVLHEIGEWLSANLEQWGVFTVDVTRETDRARSAYEVGLTTHDSIGISDVSLEQCVLHYAVVQLPDAAASPLRREVDVHLGVIDLPVLRVQPYSPADGWRAVGGSRSEVYLRARDFPELYFIMVTPEGWEGMTSEVAIPIRERERAEDVAERLERAAKLCGAV